MRITVFIILSSFALLSCGRECLFPLCSANPVFIGSSTYGFKIIGEYPIKPSEAYEAAKPYLEQSYTLRNRGRNFPKDRLNMNDYMLFKGGYFYISRDNYPYKSYWAYLKHAVKVNADTGRVIPPDAE